MVDISTVGKIIQCHIDPSCRETFVVGKPIYVDNHWFVMQDISPNGRWNGLALYMQCDVVEVNRNTPYLQRILTLLNYWKDIPPENPSILDKPVEELLCFAKEKNYFVGIELYSSGFRDITGTIDFMQENRLYVRQVNEFGEYDGVSCVCTDAISRCFINDDEAKCLSILSGRQTKTCYPDQQN